MSFANVLNKIMTERDISKAELSRISNVPYTTIDSIFKIGDNCKLSTYKKIAKALHLTLDELAGDTPVRLDITAAETRHLEKYRMLDADNRSHIDRETDFLLSEQAAAANKKDGQSSA